MATWPAGLPAPQKKISITPGDTRTERKLQSGRTEFRRFGDGKPDQAKVLFRLLWAQWETFKTFYEYDLNLGLNWFSASWLATLGYGEHKAKFLGYPREVARQGYYVDIVCTLMVQKTVWIIGEDTEWPCATTGGEVPPVGEFGYVYGGYGDSSYLQDCDEFIPDTDIWTSKSSFPAPARAYLAASTIGSSGYIYGGRDTNNTYLQDCDQYTPDTWACRTDMPAPARYALAASTIGSSGYVYGGYGADYLQDCDEYTADTWVWTCKASMPSARNKLAASTIGSSGYVYGGREKYYNFTGGYWSSRTVNDCDQYTPDTWVSKTDMPGNRDGLAASTIGNSGYIYGGSTLDCDQYTPDVWVCKSDMPSPSRHRHAASTIGSNGYIYGDTSDCDEYIPGTNTWLSKTDMPAPVRDVLAASTIST